MITRKSMSMKKIPAPSVKAGDVTLIMESGSSPLSEIQLSVRNKAEEEYRLFMKKLNEIITKKNGEIVEQGRYVTVYEIDYTPNFPASVISKDIANVGSTGASILKSASGSTLITTSQANVQSLISGNNVLLPSGSVASSGSTVFSGQPTYQLVVSPRMGLLVTPSSGGSATSIASATNTNAVITSLPSVRPSTVPRVQGRPMGNVNQQPKRFSTPIGSGKIIINPATQKSSSPVNLQKSMITASAMTTSSSVTPKIITTSVSSKIMSTSATLKPANPPAKNTASSTPTVNTRSKGKMTTRSSNANVADTSSTNSTSGKTNSTKSSTNAVVDLTDDDGKPAADSREMAINRYPGRIYPSLVVVARPHIKAKEMTSAVITAERTQLDTKVKGILTNSPTKFTEWLIQQGLVRSEQLCNIHVNGDTTPIKLKLGMYSDVSKFPHSGGYVWISDCCPQKFVSVFCNSIFEGASHAPTVLLKLMYHWSCQTNVHNIISWVKVDNLYIKNFFTNLRAVCSAAVCEKFGKIGGLGKRVEVGVISLGTTSQNGSVRQVKVEVLGIMDPVTKFVRLRAVDPVQNADKNHKLRFTKILEPLEHWVHKNTTIVTDFTVDKATLNEMGFNSVLQSQLGSAPAKESNQAIMDYLKRVVPRMFQNTLSLLSRSIIQQFLDELVWRERWGPIASKAFDNIILHIAEMTKLETGDTLVNRLKSITANPFRDWSYKNWKVTPPPTQPAKKQIGESNEADGTNKTNLVKTIVSRTKPTTLIVGKPLTVTSKLAKGNTSVSLTVDDSPDEAVDGIPSIDNLDVDDDSNSVSSNSSRRSRSRGTTVEEAVLKPLEPFYYGVLPPDAVVVNKLRKVDLNMKCFVCGLTYNNNIQFMKHLAGHAQDEGAFTTDNQCRYCLKTFTSAYDLEDHLGSTHLPNKYNSMCLICSERFKNRGALITHMQDTHVELELPYNCVICKFRCSEHTKVVDHFYEVHDGGEKVQCPFCLKVVAFESSAKTKLTKNVSFFFNHIKRHQQKRKCPKCVLSYVNKLYLKEHLSKDHHSCITIPGVIRNQLSELSTTLMPTPSATSSLSRKIKQSVPLVSKFSTYNFDGTFCFPDSPPGVCLECKNSDSASNHFASYFQCMKCMYASCCKVSINMHTATMHEVKRNRKLSLKKTIPLPKPLYCVCGFSASCGNNMASHLVHCKRRIAYPNPERAAQYLVQMQSASFPALVNLDDVEQDPNDASDKWLRAFVKNSDSHAEDKTKRPAISEKSPPRMLKELGLVRKESASNDTDEDPFKISDTIDNDLDMSSMDVDEQIKLSNGKNKRQFLDSDDDVELVLSETENNTDEPNRKLMKIELTKTTDALCSSVEKKLDEETVSSADNEKVDAVISGVESKVVFEEVTETEKTTSSSENKKVNAAVASGIESEKVLEESTEAEKTISSAENEKVDVVLTSRVESEKKVLEGVTEAETIICSAENKKADNVVTSGVELEKFVLGETPEAEKTIGNSENEKANDAVISAAESKKVVFEEASEAEGTISSAENKKSNDALVIAGESEKGVLEKVTEKRKQSSTPVDFGNSTNENTQITKRTDELVEKQDKIEKILENGDEANESSKNENSEAIQKNIDESADMETEEPSPVTEKMDDTEETSVAMECEDNVDESSMLVDNDPAQDAMIID